MASISAVSMSSWSPLVSTRAPRLQTPSASLSLLTGSRRNASFSANNQTSTSRSALLHCSFISSSSSSLAFHSSLYGLSLGLDLSSKVGFGSGKRRGLVVRAGKAALCLTKRNRSRKSLARTHGFRRRMRTTSGRAVLKRRRAKGRRVLCTKSYPRTGKGS